MVDYAEKFLGGMKVAGAFDQMKANKVAVQNQRMLGGLRRQSLGLGGESAEEQAAAQKNMLSANPEAYQKFIQGYALMGKDKRDRADEQYKRMGLGAQNILNQAQGNPEFLVPAITATAKAFADAGDMDMAKQTIQLRDLASTDAEAAMKQLKAVRTQARDIENVIKDGQGDITKIREEGRKVINDGVIGLNERLDNMETQWGKIDTLVDEAKAGNRSAVASVLVGVAKLDQPDSAVLVAEMENVLNQTNSVQAIIDYFRSKNTSQETVDKALALIDPLNPDNIKPDQIRATSRALISAQMEPMRSTWQNYEMKANDLSDAGKQSALSGNFVERLNKFDEGISMGSLKDSNQNLGEANKPTGNTPVIEIGVEEDGYKFLGGDPKDEKNWSKL